MWAQCDSIECFERRIPEVVRQGVGGTADGSDSEVKVRGMWDGRTAKENK